MTVHPPTQPLPPCPLLSSSFCSILVAESLAHSLPTPRRMHARGGGSHLLSPRWGWKYPAPLRHQLDSTFLFFIFKHGTFSSP